MADRIIKGDSGNDVVIQNNAGSRKFEVTNSGDVEITGDVKTTTVKATNLKANDGTAALVIADSTGQITASGKIDLNGNELILDVDADSSITADTDDQIDFRAGGSDSVKIGNQHLTINNGNLVLGASGKGIDFSSAQSAASGTTDEILSGYERGTWTPMLKRDGTAGTYSAHSADRGNYIRIGDLVYLNGFLRGTLSGGSGSYMIAGASQGNLPFTVETNTFALIQNSTTSSNQGVSSVSTNGIFAGTLTSGNQYGFFCLYYTTD